MTRQPGRNDPCPCGSGKKLKHCCLNRPFGQPSAPVADWIQQALAHHYNQRLSEAETLYRRVLQEQPDHPEALHYLGVLASQVGQPEAGISLISRAISARPNYADAHKSLGNLLHDIGKLEDACASYHRAIKLNPRDAGTHNNLGLALRDYGDIGGAVASFRTAIELLPNNADTHYNLGLVLTEQGSLDEAEANYRQAVQINPDFADAHRNLGFTLKRLDRLDEALESFKLSLQANGNLEETIRRLSTPLVSFADMSLKPRNATGLAQSREMSPSTQDRGDFPAAQIIPFTAFRDSSQPEFKHDAASGQSKKLRIVLIYPPPWQISSPGEPQAEMPFGPPRDRIARNLNDTDFQHIPYGLLMIAAQAKRAGHDVSVYNLSTFPWRDVVKLLAESKADIYGISAFTANRRGMGAITSLIRKLHPQAHITAGGPFVTALPLDTMKHYQDIDTAIVGEGEETFIELVEHLGSGVPAINIPGTAWRNGEEIVIAPKRLRIKNLDDLASPFDYFTSFYVMTSRGCPSKCSFCGSFTTWGRKLSFYSVASCIDLFKKALTRLPVPFIAIKDDTFTAHRRRAMEICDAIIESKMNFLWSCDSRVDSLDDELLRKMRLAGCQMISLGVESGSPKILESIHKRTTPDEVLQVTRSAQKYGMNVRFYMIVGNRGETHETIQQSIDLIRTARPNYFSFSNLSFYPGTEEWDVLSDEQNLSPDLFFENDFRELSVATNRAKAWGDLNIQLLCSVGKIDGFDYSLDEREAIAARLPELHIAHVELANAYLRARRFDEATNALNRAEALGFPIKGMILNQRACIAFARGDTEETKDMLNRALEAYPHGIVINNQHKLAAWIGSDRKNRDRPPVLHDSVHALVFAHAPNEQPCFPGALIQ